MVSGVAQVDGAVDLFMPGTEGRLIMQETSRASQMFGSNGIESSVQFRLILQLVGL